MAKPKLWQQNRPRSLQKCKHYWVSITHFNKNWKHNVQGVMFYISHHLYSNHICIVINSKSQILFGGIESHLLMTTNGEIQYKIKHVKNSCILVKRYCILCKVTRLQSWGLCGGLCGGLCITSSGGVRPQNSASVHCVAVWHLQQTVHSKLAYIGVVTSVAGVFNFESPCLSNDTCAFVVFNFWWLSLPFCIMWAKWVQWMRMCSYCCATCVLASAKVFRLSANVFRVLQRVFWQMPMCSEFCEIGDWGEMCL